MGKFVHLHLHTEYSLLDGATRISEIAEKALSDGQDAVAITDHGVMYGAVEFYEAMKSRGVKPIIGCEVYVAPRGRHKKEGKIDSSPYHLVLLCKNEIGYRNLCYMVSMSFIEGFYMKPRIDIELLREHSEGLIAMSACLAGAIPQLIISGNMTEAENYAMTMKEIFGEDFYLELQDHGLDDERKVLYGLKLLSEKYAIPMVATNDVHYLEKSDADIQATLLCIQTNNVITEGRPIGFEVDEFYFKTSDEMTALFGSYKDAIENTVRIAERCNFDFSFDNLYLPDFVPEDGCSHAEKIRKEAYLGFEERERAGRLDFSKHNRDEYIERLEYELGVIGNMGFNAYYLIVHDFVSFAKRSSIPVGPGRGSGAASLVAFCLGITDVDPMRFDLLFERFLNPERVSMPDFDIDFCYSRREEVIDYVKRRYGEDKVAQIVTFGTLAARAAVKDVGRALGIPYSRVNEVSKLIPRVMNITIDEALKIKEIDELYNSDRDIRRLLDISRKLEGMPRHASTHAAGVVITGEPTYNYVPLSYSGTGIVTQFDMNTDAKLGLVKFDFLGLRYLTVINDAERSIRERDPSFDILKIPLDDKKTFRFLCEGKTDGVFQLESGGMKQVLSRLMPSCLEDIIACVALYRPGPMDSIDKFIARKHGREVAEYSVPELKNILDVTYGCIVYQEQVMQICRELAGYSYAKADMVRRAMSKKKLGAMQAERDGFLKGCTEHGISADCAEKIFDEMVGFAKYAFNKSHATAYGVISYRTAYLKAHYPAEYFAALMTSVLDNTSKLREYIQDAQRNGVRVLPPDINVSREDFTVTDGNIRFGLLAIKNVGRQFASQIVQERQKGSFYTFDGFVSRMSPYELNKRTVESLVKCGAFDSLGITRSSLVQCYENIIDLEQNKKYRNISGQMDIFAIGDSSDATSGYEYPSLPEYSMKELLFLEKESSGMYFSGHMFDSFSHHADSLKLDSIADILAAFDEDTSPEEAKYSDDDSVRIAGIISAKRTKTVKNGDQMCFIKLEDRYSEIEVIIFPKQYSSVSRDVSLEAAAVIEGRISEEDGASPKIILSNLRLLKSNNEFDKEELRRPKNAPRIYIKLPSIADGRTASITRLAMLNRGECEVVLFDSSTKKYSVMKGTLISQSDKVRKRLCELFGEENVVIK